MGADEKSSSWERIIIPVIITGIFSLIVALISRSSPPIAEPTATPTPSQTVIVVNLLPTASATYTLTYTPQPSDTATLMPPTLTFAPTQTATLTPQPTNTPTETFTPILPTTTQTGLLAQSVVTQPIPILQLTKTAASTASPTLGFPCDARVDPNSTSTTLDVVRQFPTSNAQIVNSVRRGEPVQILEQSEGSDIYYQIQVDNQTVGWIAAQYLILSNQCPN